MKIVARRLPGALPLPVLLLLAPIAWARPLPQTGVATTAWVASTHEPNGISSAPMAEPVTDTVFEVLHTFAGGPDGANSYASLIQADDGNLYGTTYNGGGGFGCGESGCGTVFQLSYDGTRYRVLHAFQGGTDGARPEASLFQASRRTLVRDDLRGRRLRL